jgi:hypothetical protein
MKSVFQENKAIICNFHLGNISGFQEIDNINRKLAVSLAIIIIVLVSVAVFWHQTATNQPKAVDYWVLNVTSSGGGYVTPNGTIYVPLNQSGISVTATATGWNMFAKWTFDGEEYDRVSTVTVGKQPANSSHILEAHFYIGTPPFFDVARGEISVNASSYKVYNFTIPSDSTQGQVMGYFETSGGSGNNIRVYIMNSTNFDIWQQGGNATTIYDSGETVTGNISITYDSGGSYFLVYDNTADAILQKNVTTHVYYWYAP